MIKWDYKKPGLFGSAFALASAALMVNSCDNSGADQTDNPSDILSAKRPNIIYILADDLSYGDLSLNNGSNDKVSQVNTPNIDSIAVRGFNFSNGYTAAPVCAPHRATLMTARFPSVNGFESNPLIRHDDTRNFGRIGTNTLPIRLKERGYNTAVIGKWDLGGTLSGNGIIGNVSQVGNPEWLPYARGFDYFYGFLGGKNSFYRVADNSVPADGWRLDTADGFNGTAVMGGTVAEADGGRNIREFGFDGTNYVPTDRYALVQPNEHLTDIFTTKALAYIDAHANKANPFFLYLTHHAPHAPFHVPDEFYQKYLHIDSIGGSDARRIYLAMIEHMDARIGDVLAKLDEHGIRDNTIIVFTSDNGGVTINPGGQSGPADNGGLRGGKFDIWEGGIRVPFAFCWPAVYQGGQTIDDIIVNIDMMPTLLRAAGYSSSEINALGLDGIDLHPWLSKKETGPIREYFYWRAVSEIGFRNRAIMYAVRSGNLKYKFYREPGKPGEEYLFDLNANRSEDDSKNLIKDPNYNKDLIRLKLALNKWESEMFPLPAGTPGRN